LATTHFSGEIAIRKGATIVIEAIFHSSDFNAGGAYRGPAVFAGVVTSPYMQTITTLSVGLEFTQQSGDISSNCIYYVTMRNDGAQDNAVALEAFYDG
jgi:hypothetical protein